MAAEPAKDGEAVGAPADSSWLVDMMVSIMHAKTWNDPLNAFIAEKCTLFDNFEEENRHEYMEVHTEFKSLVDSLLAAHLLEFDIPPEEFEKQIVESGLVADKRLQSVLNQLMAAEDFVLFKNMMVERHATMQAQAETTFKELSAAEDIAAAEAAAIAAAQAAPGAPAAAAAASAATYTGAAGAPPAPLPTSPGGTVKPPTLAEERAFGAGGGFYGRAAMPSGSKKPASNEKAAAIRKALCSAMRPS